MVLEHHDTLATMLGSATSGMLARIPCHPLDTIKARLQVEVGARADGLLASLRRSLRSEGLAGLYRGFAITLVGSGPASLLYFTTYESVCARLPVVFPALTAVPATLTHLLAGLAAEAVSCVLWVPIDVIKERMQTQRRPLSGSMGGAAYYVSARDAIRQIVLTRGGEGVTGLYRGYGATLASFGPFSALYFAFYEPLKSAAAQRSGTAMGSPLPLTWQVAVACAAGGSASLLTNPLDLAKLRLQVQRSGGCTSAGADAFAVSTSAATTPAFHYRGLVDALVTIVRTEGWTALLKGAGARVAFHAPSTAITLTTFERCRAAYASLLAER